MIGSLVAGTIWALVSYIVGYGYFFFSISKARRESIYSSKAKILLLDITIIILGGMSMKAAGGSVTAGIGTAVLGILCFTTSMALYGLHKLKTRNKFRHVNFQ